VCRFIDEAFMKNKELMKEFTNCPASSNEQCSKLIEFVEDRLGHDRRYSVEAKKLKFQLGYESQFSFEVRLREAVKWYIRNHQWWGNVIDKFVMSEHHRTAQG